MSRFSFNAPPSDGLYHPCAAAMKHLAPVDTRAIPHPFPDIDSRLPIAVRPPGRHPLTPFHTSTIGSKSVGIRRPIQVPLRPPWHVCCLHYGWDRAIHRSTLAPPC